MIGASANYNLIEELWSRDNANREGAQKSKDRTTNQYFPDEAKPCSKHVGKFGRANFKWRAERDFEGEICDLHLLNCDLCFGDFISEYSVGRGISKGSQSELREYLRNDRLKAAMDNHGRGLDELAETLKAKKLTRGLSLSLVSKVAALAKPQMFSPYDSFARDGIGDRKSVV